MVKIVNVEPSLYSIDAKGLLEEENSYLEYNGNFTIDELLIDADVIITRLGYSINAEFIKKTPQLKVIVTATTGLDHIDLDLAKKKGIEVLSLKGETKFLSSITATAELTWGLLLSLIRRIPRASADVMKGNWNRDCFRGYELQNKTLGIIGYGRLGKIVAKYGDAFGMKVIAYDPHISNGSVPLVGLNQLMSESDVISLHVPYTESTNNLLGEKEFALTKKGTLLINTSRGSIINESELLKMLNGGHIGGAALDVLSGEELFREGADDWPASDQLVKYAKSNDNLIIVPHIGGLTYDSAYATEMFMAKKLISFLNDK